MILEDFGYTELPIVFNRDTHRYKLDKIYLIGTTSVLGVRHKEFLMYWTVKEMYAFLKKHWDIGKTYTLKEKEELLLSGKKAWLTKKDEALDAGKITHQLIQESIERDIRFEDLKYDNIQLQQEVQNAYNAWVKWDTSHKVEYFASELVVGSKRHYIGGTIDCVAKVDGQLNLIDWKTSKYLSRDVFLQLAAYKLMLLEGGVNSKIKRMAVRFDKSNGDFEELQIKSDYVKDVTTFLALLNVYRWERDTKKKFEDKFGKLKDLITLK